MCMSQNYEDKQRLIIMESEAQCSLCQNSASANEKARLETEV